MNNLKSIRIAYSLFFCLMGKSLLAQIVPVDTIHYYDPGVVDVDYGFLGYEMSYDSGYLAVTVPIPGFQQALAIYEKTNLGWEQKQVIRDITNGQVFIHKNGWLIFQGKQSNSDPQGKVFVYKRDMDGSYGEYQTLFPDSSWDGQFGRAITFDGTTIAITSDGTAPLALFTLENSQWQNSYNISRPEPEGRFGLGIALEDNLLAISYLPDAGPASVYVYEQSANDWQIDTILASGFSDRSLDFGESMAINQGQILIGDKNHNGGGAAFLLEKEIDSSWITKQELLIPNDGITYRSFGKAVDFSNEVMLVYAQEGITTFAFVYRKVSASWEFEGKFRTEDTPIHFPYKALEVSGKQYWIMGANFSLSNPYGRIYGFSIPDQNLTVSTVLDSGANSLRSVIANAPAGSTINFDSRLIGQTILLTQGSISIDKDLHIESSSPGQNTISADFFSNIFVIDSVSELHLLNLSFTKGKDSLGGLIQNHGSLVLENVSLSGGEASHGGAIFNAGNLIAQEVIWEGNFAQNGGGVYSTHAASTQIVGGLFENNEAILGGGIYAKGGSVLEIAYSSLIRNRAEQGGAIFNKGSLGIETSTLAENIASQGGGIYQAEGDWCINSSTIAKNTATQVSGGIFHQGTGKLFNSVIGDNEAGSFQDLNFADSILSNGYNLIQDTLGLSLLSDSTDILGRDPLLNNLEYEAGSFKPIWFLRPLGNSPLINTGSPIADSLDQRLVLRDSFPDIGAIELDCKHEIWVSTVAADGPGSLKEAIETACPGAWIRFQEELSGDTIYLPNNALEPYYLIDKDLKIEGLNADDFENEQAITINGGKSLSPTFEGASIFEIAQGANVVISNINFHGGLGSFGNGIGDITTAGAITNRGDLELFECTFRDNSAEYAGAIGNHDPNASLRIRNCTFYENGNTQGRFGGAIRSSGFCSIENSHFENNEVNVAGVLLGRFDSISNSRFISNYGHDGIFSFSNVTEITNCLFYDNGNSTIAYYFAFPDTLKIRHSTIIDNRQNIKSFFQSTENTLFLENSYLSKSTETGTLFPPENQGNRFSLQGTNNYISDSTHANIIYDSAQVYLGNGANLLDPLFDTLLIGKTEVAFIPRVCSPLINAGSPLDSINYDIRGIPRDSLPDVGAFEYIEEDGNLYFVSTETDEGPGSLRNIIENACNGAEIQFAESLRTLTLDQSKGLLIIDKDLRFIGHENGTLKWRGFGGITVAKDADVYMERIEIRRGWTSSDTLSGGITNLGKLSLYACSFVRNSSINGGHIFNRGTLDARECTFDGNDDGPYFGGAILNEGSASIQACSFKNLFGNVYPSGETGGSAIANKGKMEVLASTFHNLPEYSDSYEIILNLDSLSSINNTFYTIGSDQIFTNEGYLKVISNTMDLGEEYNILKAVVNKKDLVIGHTVMRGYGTMIQQIGDSTNGSSLGYNVIMDTVGSNFPFDEQTSLLADENEPMIVDFILDSYETSSGFLLPILKLQACSPGLDIGGTLPVMMDARGIQRDSLPDAGAIELILEEKSAHLLVTHTGDHGPGSLDFALTNYCRGDSIRFSPELVDSIFYISKDYYFEGEINLIGGRLDAPIRFVGNGGKFRFDKDILDENETGSWISGVHFMNFQSEQAGGAIYCEDNLTLFNCVFTNNEASSGGAIYCEGDLIVLNTLFIENKAINGNGGAIEINGNIELGDCIFSNNHASESGGAVFAWYNGTTNVAFNHIIQHCTFTQNHSNISGGAVGFGPETGNGYLINTIIASNTSPLAPDLNIADNYEMLSFGGNLIGDIGNLSNMFTEDDLWGTSTLPLDPKLTMVKLAGIDLPAYPSPCSFAVDLGDSPLLGFDTDIRGFPRDDNADAGALEIPEDEKNPIAIVTTTADDGPGSLREAIRLTCPGKYIPIRPDLVGQTISLQSPLLINKPLAIRGIEPTDPLDISNYIRISGNDSTQLIRIDSAMVDTVRLFNLAFEHGNTGENGGAIFNNGNIIAENCIWMDNEGHMGGAIYSSGYLSIHNSTFTRNRSSDDGGAIKNSVGILVLNNSSFIENVAGADGGAISLIRAENSISNNTFWGNEASIAGAIQISHGKTVLSHNTLTQNISSWASGLILSNGENHFFNNLVVENGPENEDDVYISIPNGTLISENNIFGKLTTTFGLVLSETNFYGTIDTPFASPVESLADNGGPTPTAKPFLSSSAVNAALPNVLSIDQRGLPRDNRPDIGAFELGAEGNCYVTRINSMGEVAESCNDSTFTRRWLLEVDYLNHYNSFMTIRLNNPDTSIRVIDQFPLTEAPQTFEVELPLAATNWNVAAIIGSTCLLQVDSLFTTTGSCALPEPELLYRVNAGGIAFPDSLMDWSPDKENAPSPYYATTNSNNTTGWDGDQNIAHNLNVPTEIFGTHRWDGPWGDEMMWAFPVGNGSYVVRLYFAETKQDQAQVGSRVFDIYAEGQAVLSNLDVYAEAGYRAGIVKTLNVDVEDGNLDLMIQRVIGNPMLSGIEVLGYPIQARNAPNPSVSAYPNPFTNVLSLDMEKWTGELVQLEVRNTIGQSVFKSSFRVEQSRKDVNLSHLSEGLYQVRIVGKRVNAVIPIMKK